MFYWVWFRDLLERKSTIWLLFFINLFGTIYGFIWYWPQLIQTPWGLWIFVPDSPTASLFFTIVLFGYLLGKRWKLIEALSAITLFKYGIWAVVMIFLTGLSGGSINWTSYMLVLSHLGMAAQALLFSKYFTFGWKHLMIVAIWTITNDIMDYSLGIFPMLYSGLHPYLGYIYGFTVSLSFISLLLFYRLVVKRAKFSSVA
ncbi:putative membrane protein YpjA [Evansella vedderi]|uniref:Membrane protein YpjA n=1 Tax=Evansella vedderi TaxID=38282 RepID=A0ABU0A024_9BACI|nr:DUF1405 domain-containing protein [Evansella vedderi]MDQ0256362.1 putative membrane protein YpjA [Evansella vedderi]